MAPGRLGTPVQHLARTGIAPAAQPPPPPPPTHAAARPRRRSPAPPLARPFPDRRAPTHQSRRSAQCCPWGLHSFSVCTGGKGGCHAEGPTAGDVLGAGAGAAQAQRRQQPSRQRPVTLRAPTASRSSSAADKSGQQRTPAGGSGAEGGRRPPACRAPPRPLPPRPRAGMSHEPTGRARLSCVVVSGVPGAGQRGRWRYKPRQH